MEKMGESSGRNSRPKSQLLIHEEKRKGRNNRWNSKDSVCSRLVKNPDPVILNNILILN
jgi:hypothetical protein